MTDGTGGAGGGSAEAFDEVFEPLVDAAIDHAAAELGADLVELRRDLGRHAELAGAEGRSAALVAEHLRAAGLSVETGVGGHGVLAVVHGTGGSPGDGPAVAYHATMTAVPAEPAAGSSGAARLCGHDVLTAAGVGVAAVLARLRDRIRGRAVFVFQPAALAPEGAAVIASGLLERTAPREIYALHCAPLPVGTLGVAPGPCLPGRDRFTVHVLGPARAAAEAAAAAAARLDALSTVRRPLTADAWRHLAGLSAPGGPPAEYVAVETYTETDPAAGGDATACDASGSHASGGIPTGGVRIHGSVRARPDGRYADVRAAVRALAAELPGARVEFAGEPVPATACSPELAEAGARRIRRTLAALRTSGAIPDRAGDHGGVVTLHGALPFDSDDVGPFLRRVPGAVFHLGAAEAAAGPNGPPHHRAPAPDEAAIGVGVRTMAALLCHRITALT